MMSVPLTKATVLKKLESIYWCALKDGNWHAALRAVELQGKAVGLFEKQLLPKVVRITDMTEEQLTEFIDRLEEREPTLKNQEGEAATEGHLPEKQSGGKDATFDSPLFQGRTATERKFGKPADPVSFAPATCSDISERREAPLGEPIDTLYFREQHPAEDPILPLPPLEWEKPPPFAHAAS